MNETSESVRRVPFGTSLFIAWDARRCWSVGRLGSGEVLFTGMSMDVALTIVLRLLRKQVS